MALSPTSPNIRSANVGRNIDNTGQVNSSSRFVYSAVEDYAVYPGHAASSSDLPFRTIDWGQGHGVISSSHTARVALPFEEYHQRTPAYAPTATYTSTSPYSATPRFIPPFTASAVPSYVCSLSAPTHAKRRSDSGFSDMAPPSIKIKSEDGENVKTVVSPLPLTGRRRSSANKQQCQRNVQQFESWRKKRKEQKMRLEFDAARYEAEQEALFSAHRGGHGLVSAIADEGEIAIKQERDGGITIKEDPIDEA
ncbi:MAG: hypothetical protein Q9221_005776 [Calogaya cf. arnoldii]